MLLKIPDKRSHSINQNNKMFQMRTFWLRNGFAFDEIKELKFLSFTSADTTFY